jgi:type II secretory pathway predicted ATPase ExeA
MYKEFYGLTGDPFRLSPDHHFCYRYPSFAKGRAYMQYALQAAEGFVVVTGQPGMGKTTLINDLLSDYGPRDYTIATLVNTMLEANEVLRSAAYEFGVNVEGMDTATVLQRLKQLFTQAKNAGRPPLLVVDEAQNLTLTALEELRMLTNLQANGSPLLQIFLVGQEELREKLQDNALEQLRQRVTAAAHLYPLTQEQVASYIIHRLKVVGWKGRPKLKASLLPVLDIACEGVPRRVNQFCSRLLLHGAVEQKLELGAEDARLVFSELSEERLSRVPIDLGNSFTSDDTALGADDEDLYEDPQADAAQHKVVMPPPPVDDMPDLPLVKPPPVDLPPSGHETRPPSEPHQAYQAYSNLSDQLAGTVEPAPEKALSSPAAYPMHAPIQARYRPPRRPWFSLLIFILLVAGAGAYTWYQMDQKTREELFGLEVDSYLRQLRGETDTLGESVSLGTSEAEIAPGTNSDR